MKYRLLGCLLLLPLLLMAQERPKVAIVLSGGGAKGTAHIGALKVIEKAGIPIDYVVGTSSGGYCWRLICHRVYSGAIGQYGECAELEVRFVGRSQS